MTNPLIRRIGVLGLFLLLAAPATASDDKPIRIGLNAEVGHISSTSDDAIRQGMLIAIDEINGRGGILGGRKLELVVRDNRAVPARALANFKELAAIPDLVGVFCGKFSSAILDSLPYIHEAGLPLLDPWAANDKVVDNGFAPNFAFRLSLKDSWAIPAMMNYASRRGFDKVGPLLVNTSWGRNNNNIIRKFAGAPHGVSVLEPQWFNYGDKTLMPQYQALRNAGAKAILLVAIESESALLIREVAALPPAQRLPIISHWSIAGGDMRALAGDALSKVDVAFVQTFDLHTNRSAKARRVLATARKLFNIRSFKEVKSPAGLAHAYDLTHILAMAVEKAGSTDRRKVRDALEQVAGYDGLIRYYDRPFTPSRHEALGPEIVFMARFARDGTIRPAR